MEDYYKSIGTSRKAIMHKRLDSTEEEISRFIREKYEYMIRMINNKESLIREPEELEKQIEEVTNAYNQIKTQRLRDLYEQKLDGKEQQGTEQESRKARTDTIYEVSNFSRESMELNNDEKVEDYYKIIGTSREAIMHKRLDYTQEEIDEFIKEKYEYMIRGINIKKGLIREPEELEKQIKEVTNAYNRIKTQSLRDLYEQKSDEKEQQGKEQKPRRTRIDTIYERLNFSRESMELREDEENDRMIKQRKDIMIEQYSKELEKLHRKLEDTRDFKEKEKIRTKIGIIEQNIDYIKKNYEKIKTKELREEYDAQLQERLKREENIQQQEEEERLKKEQEGEEI